MNFAEASFCKIYMMRLLERNTPRLIFLNDYSLFFSLFSLERERERDSSPTYSQQSDSTALTRAKINSKKAKKQVKLSYFSQNKAVPFCALPKFNPLRGCGWSVMLSYPELRLPACTGLFTFNACGVGRNPQINETSLLNETFSPSLQTPKAHLLILNF